MPGRLTQNYLLFVLDMAHFYPDELIKQFPGLSAIYDDDDNAADGTPQDSQDRGENVSFLVK